MKLLFLAVVFGPVLANRRLNYFYRHHRKTTIPAVNVFRNTKLATNAVKTARTPVVQGMWGKSTELSSL